MKWKEYSILTEGICVEAVSGIFHKMGSGGVVIEDPQAARRYENLEKFNPDSVSPDFMEHDFVVVKAYFPEDKKIQDELEQFLKKVEDNFKVKCKIFIGEVRDEDWEESWKKYYHTFKVGHRLVIKPSWEEYSAQDSEVVIDIDPGMAFGTGIHASTRFCLKFVDEYIKGGETIVDAGCGSGILSIAAAKLGARHILAMDIDEVAVRIAKENVHLNGLDGIIEVAAGDIIEELAGREIDHMLANITAEVVNHLIPEAAKVLPPGGYMFCSGIVDSRWPGVQKQLTDYGFAIDKVLTDVDWVGVAARKL
ncbi:Ribosomal protein L11 methyltransferase [Syntrophomonas zehnderi OL-4]|uniref:Ribosomal protein L11 methyltransferase n=1 Tax=Syntrophomonas zehnderi OL-4 TaxID=690567 RepID=A0A0E3W3Q8_9FIRM|nr:50S ribosomal protein L11 methyltransferase [Syntrophomonas zehnderi]CFX99084.1 Ribosomal protein L11 methyltransferase [Syntrophomonas zehnderi OL-4]